ncbi:PLCXD3 [Branchiostoma lanceolatum]|uniref:PLCXD3 protein n=1 Tax=Branchiostoma lanceolatum TaxID=7740 RepID=A0A8J9YXP3_BRALA|nr:PLCXD3 [Branchiostoma lanceolatum]
MSRMATDLPHGLDLAKWMTGLPPDLRTAPLKDLAIPGTHDSGSFYQDKSFDLSPVGQQLTDIIHDEAVQILGLTVNDVVNSWSVTQLDIGFTGQLNVGVRYFDLRVAWRESDNSLYFVHGLYGMKVETAMLEIADWLISHPKEVVLLDFNHFYSMDDSHHKHLIAILKDKFGSKLCPKTIAPNPVDVTLAKLWENRHQVIVFYNNNEVADHHTYLWSDWEYIHSPDPNTHEISKLIDFLDKEACTESKFNVSQAILMPDAATIVGNLGHSQKTVLATPAMPHVVRWLSRKRSGSGRHGVNIVIADFVDLEFLLAVTKLNYT